MNASTSRSRLSGIARICRPGLLAWLLLVAGASACVTENTTTGEMVPRGGQRYPWEKVKELAKKLKKDMTKTQVMLLMGSPAEIDKEDNQWIYLPERYAILVPAQSLQLDFKGTVLVDFGYRPIVFGAQL
jgi:outer membrane protein assembly factor BamE (lipoprotein component of BamABCDE complex)